MNLSAAELLKLLYRHNLRVFTTADIITLTGLRPSAAVMALARLADGELIARVKRGVWVNALIPDFNPYEALPYLRAPWPAYVSLYSVLSDRGVVEEIPHLVYGVSAATPKRYKTAVGEFHIHHLPERLMWGYEIHRQGAASYPAAEPEKAFLDLAYLALTPRSPLELPRKRERRWSLGKRKLALYARKFRFQPLTDWLKRERLI